MKRSVVLCTAVLLAAFVSASVGSASPVLAHGQTVVAVVESASGGHLAVRRTVGGGQIPLHADGKVFYGDIVLAGPGATAQFKVTVPRGMSADSELLFIQPVSGAHHTVTMQGSGAVVEVTLGP